MSKLTHALTFDEVTNNFEVFSIDKFYNLKQPTSKNDFTIYSNYLINSGKNCMLEVEIVELGDMESLKKSLQNISSAIISHGLVQFVNGDDLAVIPLSNIEEFKNYVPQYKQRFHKSKIYRGKRNNKTDYQDIRIHGLGEHAEMLKAFEVLNAQSKLLTHALIRFIKDDSLQVVNINEIIEFGRIKPKTYVDYKKYTPYKIKINDDVKLIQILKLSNFEECAAYIDIFNELTHALVRCITKDETCVTMLHNIKEFQQDKPDHARDFKQDTLYTLEDQSGRNYIAVQIYSLGHETLLQYNLINAKRFKKTKFNRSDIKSVENAALSDSEDLSPHEDECNEESNNESDNDSNESPTKKKHLLKRKEKRISIEKLQQKLSDKQYVLKNTETLNFYNKKGVSRNDHDNLDERILSERISNLRQKEATKVFQATSTAERTSARGERITLTPRTLFHDKEDDIIGTSLDKNSETTSKNKTSNAKKMSNADKHGNQPSIKFHSRKRKHANQQSYRNLRKTMLPQDSEEFYEINWSDSSIGETDEYSIFEEWTDTESENNMTMIHLGWNESISKKSWSLVKKSANPKKFIKNLSRCLWKNRIVEKCLEVKKSMKQVTDKPRTEVEPQKMKVLYQTLKFWILTYHADWLENYSIDELLNGVTSALSEEIAYQIRMYEHVHSQKENNDKTQRSKWKKY